MKKTKLIQKIYSNNEIENISQKLKCLGKNAKYDALTFCSVRLWTTVIIFFLSLILIDHGYIFAPFITIGYYYLFYYLNITRKLNSRNKRLEHEALYFFEILALTLESGRNLNNALEVTCENINSEISDEFKQTLYDMKFGKTLIESLEDMKNRISSDIINNIILNLIQTSQFGSSILETLNMEIDFLREKQILDVKKQINQIPNKVSIISVIFIVPLIIILVLGPYLIDFIN